MPFILEEDLQKIKDALSSIFYVINNIAIDKDEVRRAKEVSANPDFLSGKTQQNNSALLFDNKEIQKMPKEFRRLFRAGKVTAHIRKKENGSYEIRCTVNKIPVSSCGKTLASAKERFIAKLNDIVGLRAHEAAARSDLRCGRRGTPDLFKPHEFGSRSAIRNEQGDGSLL